MPNIVKTSGDFKIFQPEPQIFEEITTALKEKTAANEHFLAEHGELEVPERAITGSFIYAHPPDYRRSMIGLGQAQWKDELSRLQDLGVDTVVFQAAAWKELRECYYPSRIFDGFQQWDVLTPAIAAAKDLGLSFFLGELGSVVNFQENPGANDAVFQREVLEHLSCVEELTALFKGGFQGFYAASESLFDGTRNLRRESGITLFYKMLFGKMRECCPGLPILISPASYDCGDAVADAADYWCAVFSGAAPDIIAPQDSIGCVCVSLYRQHLLYEQWQKTAQKLGCRLWSNIELFEPIFDAPGRSAFKNASAERIAAQIRAAAPAEKLICWEMLEFHQ